MFCSYFDESGTDDADPVFVVAGLISTPILWEKLTRDWQRVLHAEGLEEFHMSDCATGHGPIFGNWPKEKRNRVVTSLVQLIKRRVKYRTWAAIVMRDYQEIFAPNDLMYGMCAFCCATRIRVFSTQLPSQPYIPYTFDQGGRGGPKTLAAFEALIADERKNEEFYRMGLLSKGNRRLCPPLQAADVHAWEVHKYFADRLKASKRPPRKSILELLSIKEAGGGGHLIRREEWAQIIPAMKRRDRIVPARAVPLGAIIEVNR